MIGTVAGDEPAEIVALDAELGADLGARPQLHHLAVPGSQCRLVAQALLLLLCVREEKPAAGREVADDPFADDDVAEPLAVVQRETQHDRCLAPGLGFQHLRRQLRVAAAQELQPLVGHPLVQPDRVFRDRLEGAGIASARLARRVAAIDHRDAQVAAAGRLGQVIGGRRPRQAHPDDQDVDRRRQRWLRPETRQRMAAAKPERLVVEREPDRQRGCDAQAGQQRLVRRPGTRGECGCGLEHLKLARLRRVGAAIGRRPDAGGGEPAHVRQGNASTHGIVETGRRADRSQRPRSFEAGRHRSIAPLQLQSVAFTQAKATQDCSALAHVRPTCP